MTLSKTKVLHIITRLVVGGAQDNTILTLQNHDRQKYHVSLASNPHGPWRQKAEEASDEFYTLENLVNPISPTQDFQTLTAIIKLLQTEKFDIVHTHSSKAGILGRLAANFCNVPVVHTVHGFPFHDFMPPWQKKLYTLLEKWFNNRSDFIITVSELNRKQAIELGIASSDKTKTIYSGIDFTKLDQSYEVENLKSELRIEPNTKIITMVGRLDQQKAPYYLIEAFAKVLNELPDIILLLVGEGELETSLKSQVQELKIEPKVKFLGSRDDVPAILNITDIFSLSSLWEGLGRAMTEAMLMGIPVVVPNIYGIPEIVHHNETGLLFEAKNTDQLARYLVYLLNNPQERQRLGQNAKALTRRLFDGQEMVRQIEVVYETILDKYNKL